MMSRIGEPYPLTPPPSPKMGEGIQVGVAGRRVAPRTTTPNLHPSPQRGEGAGGGEASK
jgi:hypothetical protein